MYLSEPVKWRARGVQVKFDDRASFFSSGSKQKSATIQVAEIHGNLDRLTIRIGQSISKLEYRQPSRIIGIRPSTFSSWRNSFWPEEGCVHGPWGSHGKLGCLIVRFECEKIISASSDDSNLFLQSLHEENSFEKDLFIQAVLTGLRIIA